jgi:hypothetical protein
VEDDGNERPARFPSAPEGIARMEHLPTVLASIRYWEAVRVHAIEAREPALELTAMALRDSYEQARQELTKAERSPKKQAAPRSQPSRLQSKPSRDRKIKE